MTGVQTCALPILLGVDTMQLLASGQQCRDRRWIIAGGDKRRYALAEARAAGGLCHGRSVDPDRVGRDLQVECCGGDRRIGDERGDDGAAHHALAA